MLQKLYQARGRRVQHRDTIHVNHRQLQQVTTLPKVLHLLISFIKTKNQRTPHLHRRLTHHEHPQLQPQTPTVGNIKTLRSHQVLNLQ